MSNRTANQRAKPEECDCCGFVTNELSLFKDQDTTIAGGGKTRIADFWYCDLCCCTPTSMYNRYPGQSPSNTDILKTVCYVGNEILKALRKRS